MFLSPISFLTLLLFSPIAFSQTTQGIIGLWSDSECNSFGDTSDFGQQDPIDLNFTLDPDRCGVPGATVHSYRIRQNAVCANGTGADFVYYESKDCSAEPTDENPDGRRKLKRGSQIISRQRSNDGDRLVGSCLALIAFNSLAFVCDGVSYDNAKIISTLTSAAPSTSTGPSSTIASSDFASAGFPPASVSGSASNPSANRTSTASIQPPVATSQQPPAVQESNVSESTGIGASPGLAIRMLGIAAILATLS
ncbi:MAG: hypothetical protein Q9164_006071 [Protoblastenia rupestris]